MTQGLRRSLLARVSRTTQTTRSISSVSPVAPRGAPWHALSQKRMVYAWWTSITMGTPLEMRQPIVRRKGLESAPPHKAPSFETAGIFQPRQIGPVPALTTTRTRAQLESGAVPITPAFQRYPLTRAVGRNMRRFQAARLEARGKVTMAHSLHAASQNSQVQRRSDRA